MKKILLIEDDQVMRENIAELITLTGYEVEVAENGMIGIEKTTSFKPDLIICDIMMPELDGYGVLYILSQKPETASIPFIFLTAKSEKDDLRKGMELGADDYLFKPFDSTELIRAIKSRLKKHNLLKKEFSNNKQGIHDFLNEAQKILSLEDLTQKAHQFSYSAKELIFKENEHVHFIYYVEEGQIKTYRYNDDGKEYITAIFNEGSFFGYQPIFEDRTYNEIAEAIVDTKVLKISKDAFLSLIYQNREVAKKFIILISKNLSNKEEELMHMAYSSVKKRVSKKLQELLGDKDEISILRSDLAKLTGTTKETLTRTITEFKQSNIIETDGKKIILKDREKLQKMDLFW
ncbi:MAG: response regulator [Vicingaceae bacterium]|jgi:DNA-binding response OmpR family regulator|nr:response regulator [Vicingaceae bacterium]